jgi:hypothetical protein
MKRRNPCVLFLAALFWLGSAVPAEAASKSRSNWKTSVAVGLETIYDDNFLRYSDDYLADFYSGASPYKFRIDRKDSHILAPSLDVYAQRRLIGLGNTRFRFKVKTWQYVQGDIKSNTGYDWYIRQYLPGGRSLELWYNYAPEQYIRELSDRSPLDPPSSELVWEQFRYTRNVFNVIWRQSLGRDVNLKLWFNRGLRYYNQPFMENDIKDLGLRATIYWDVHRDWRLTLDYGYSHAPARGADEVGETLESSDNSDPSYDRDLFQVDVTWKPDWAAPVFDAVGVRAQHQLYWFTSQKALEDDPYHVGRKDIVWSYEVEFERGLGRSVDLNVGWRLAIRTVESPWDGDIAEDKDYDQRRYWIGLTYKL